MNWRKDWQATDEVMRSELGRQAIDEGWARGLWQFAMNHGRRPDAHELSRIKQARYAAERAAVEVLQGEYSESLLSLWARFEAHERELQQRYGQ